MKNTDKDFDALMEILQNDASGLLALSEIMESHMRYSIDPRLSADPLTALAAVMREHDLKFEFGRESDSYCWSYVSSPKIEGIALHSTAKYRGVILFSDIKPEHLDEIKQDKKDND